MPERKISFTRRIVMTMWLYWVVAFGAIALELLLPRLMPKSWLPLPVFLIAYAELVYLRMQQQQETSGCTAMLKVSVLTLFWSAFIMLAINILNSRMLLDNLIDWSNSNREIPFITCLIIFPVMMVMCLWVMARGYGRKDGFTMVTGGVVDSLFRRESKYQVQLMLCISVGLTAVEYWYYFEYYFNVNMNTPDVFFFNWMPISLYVFSLFFVLSRYRNIAAIVGPIAKAESEEGVCVRFMVLSGDRMLLALNEYDRWDTPAIVYLPAMEANSEMTVRRAFERLAETEDFTLRYLYDTGTGDAPDTSNYAAILPEEHYGKNDGGGSWFTLDQLDRMMKCAQLSAELSDEIYRIFTITMAWKTYDRNGRRLYPIKNYRPTFRLRDLQKWDVDYRDMAWLNIARVNQDKPFFRVRRLWSKVTGLKI